VNKNYNSAFVEKLKILKANKNKRKIILIGGSSVGWGISAKKITQETGIQTINLGHHAGFGIIDFLPFVSKQTNSNDIIIFSPEWVFYTNPSYSDKATLKNLKIQNIGYNRITENTIGMLQAILFHTIDFEDIVKFYGSRSKKLPIPNKEPYRYDCINNYGDVTSHYGLKKRGPKPYGINIPFDILSFRKKFEIVNDTNCYLLFPPTQRNIYNKNKKYLDSIEIELSGLNIINNLISNVYDEEDFFDAEYHLTFQANSKRTHELIEFVKAEIIKKDIKTVD
jgi:hypothetical protein